MKTTRPKHYLGRPGVTLTDCQRLTNRGKWVADDGKTPGKAFSGKEGMFPMAHYPQCECGHRRCPERLAMDETMRRWGVANGRTMRKPRARP